MIVEKPNSFIVDSIGQDNLPVWYMQLFLLSHYQWTVKKINNMNRWNTAKFS